MMKKIVLFLIFCSHLSFAQLTNQSGIIILPPSKAHSYLSSNDAQAHVKMILDSINWKANFILQEQVGINNAYATIIRDKRYIIIDNKFLNALDQYANTPWASISVLAHEMGHHYRNHLFTGNGSTPATELEADHFSGYALAKVGASLAEATAAIQKISPIQGDASHPGRAARVEAIRKGWYYANPTNTAASSARPSVPQPQQNPPPPVDGGGWINLALYGNNAMTVYLSDDGRNYNPAALKTTQPFVFKFEMYNYGYLRLVNSPNAITYKLMHNKDYSIIWNRKTNNWTVVEVK